LFGIAALVVAADVATKQLAVNRWADEPITVLGGLVTLTESRNPGAAFGFATNATPVLALFAAAVVIALVMLSGRFKTITMAVVGGLLLGGAAGNLVDRLFRPPGVLYGHVVDWIDVGSYPNFNLADSALTVASVLLVVWSLTGKHDDPEPAT
jgi:signal peptidase II